MSLIQSSNEVFDNIFRLSLAPNKYFEFNQFLILDEKTCLIHTGKLSLFDSLKTMALKHLGSRGLDYIVFSHFEADECGSVNRWLDEFPSAQVYCNKIANINLGDFLSRPANVLKDGEILNLGTRRLKLIETPHFPHNWDAHMWFEETESILFSSDFCCQGGITEPIAMNDVSSDIISFYENGMFIPYGKTTNENLSRIERIKPLSIAPMHGSVIKDDLTSLVLETVASDLREKSLA